MPLFWDFLYVFAAITVGPFWLAARLMRRKPLAPWRARLLDFPRLGPADGHVIWVHGVSVGEVLAARGLVASLEAEHPGARVVISTTTTTGHDVARRTFPKLTVFYCPLDLSWCVRRCVRGVRPTMVVLMELELWPNLLHHLLGQGIPVVVANGKMSARSLRGYRRLLRAAPGFLDGVHLFCMQNEAYGLSLKQLRVPTDRIKVTGSLKVDNLPSRPEEGRRAALRAALGLAPDAPVLVAGSTHDGEEEIVFEAYARLRESRPDVRLVVAPRHLERLEAVERAARAAALTTVRRTRAAGSMSPEAVILLDTMGELADLFAAGDVVLMGGSLVPVGGHNILEPAAQAKPVLFGPYMSTIRLFAEEMLEAGGARQVNSADELAAAAGEWLDDAEARREAGERALGVVQSHRGATERTYEALEGVLRACSRAAT